MAKFNLNKKFIIGTANFSQTYGAKPTNVCNSEIIKDFEFGKKK